MYIILYYTSIRTHERLQISVYLLYIHTPTYSQVVASHTYKCVKTITPKLVDLTFGTSSLTHSHVIAEHAQVGKREPLLTESHYWKCSAFDTFDWLLLEHFVLRIMCGSLL